jgi:Trk K+ transport system NAD-binding subunit
LTSTPQLWSPVIDDGRHVIGTIAISDIARSYRGAILANLRRANAEAGPNGAADVLVSARSSLIGAALKSRVVPRGVLVTSIERAGQILQPEGDSVIKEGDHLLVLGGEQDIEDLERLACSHSG